MLNDEHFDQFEKPPKLTPQMQKHLNCKCHNDAAATAEQKLSALELYGIEAKAHRLFHEMPPDLIDNVALVIPHDVYQKHFDLRNKVVVTTGNGHVIPLVPGFYHHTDSAWAVIDTTGRIISHI